MSNLSADFSRIYPCFRRLMELPAAGSASAETIKAVLDSIISKHGDTPYWLFYYAVELMGSSG